MKRFKVAFVLFLVFLFFTPSVSQSYQINHLNPQTETEDFYIQFEKDKVDLLAGKQIEIGFTIFPNPTFTHIIQLSYKSIEPSESEKFMMEFNFSLNGHQILNAPFKTSIYFTFSPKTPESTITLTIKAVGIQDDGSPFIEHSYPITAHILYNEEAYIPPTLTLLSPDSNPFLTNEINFPIKGVTNAKQLQVNKVEIDPNPIGEFICPVRLSEGRNQITFKMQRWGLVNYAETEIILDSKPPILTLETIPANAFTPFYLLKGKTEPDINLWISINASNPTQDKKLVGIDMDGNFSVSIPLKKGINAMIIQALDKAGNNTQINKTIFYATKIELKIGNQTAIINSQSKKMDASPFIKQGRTMVPLYIFSEALELSNKYISASQEIVISNPSKTLKLKIGSRDVWITTYIQEIGQVGDILIHLDTVPEIKNKRTFVPLRFISEQFGFAVTWNSKDSSIVLTNEVKGSTEEPSSFLSFPIHKIGERIEFFPLAVTVNKVYLYNGIAKGIPEQNKLRVDLTIENISENFVDAKPERSNPFTIWDNNGNRLREMFENQFSFKLNKYEKIPENSFLACKYDEKLKNKPLILVIYPDINQYFDKEYKFIDNEDFNVFLAFDLGNIE